MTPQEAFDKAATGLLTQKTWSGIFRKDSGFSCLYRDPEGHKCAIGHLIPDEEYRKEFESLTPANLEALNILPPALKGLDLSFLCTLQSIHDENPPALWKVKLHRFTKKHNLTAAILETLP